MNVIGSRPDGWWRDRRGAMTELVRRLGYLKGRKVTAVLDGREWALEAPEGVEVVFAPGGRNAADDMIVRLLAEDPPPRPVVVTSDRALADRVREFGAEVRPAGSFLRELDAADPGAAD